MIEEGVLLDDIWNAIAFHLLSLSDMSVVLIGVASVNTVFTASTTTIKARKNWKENDPHRTFFNYNMIV